MSKWQEILDESKKKLAELKKQNTELDEKISREAHIIFEAKKALKEEKKRVVKHLATVLFN